MPKPDSSYPTTFRYDPGRVGDAREADAQASRPGPGREGVSLPAEAVAEILAIVEEGVVGFDQVEAWGRSAGAAAYGRELVGFVEGRRIGRKLARARRLLAEAVEANGGRERIAALDEALRAVPDWTPADDAKLPASGR